MKKKKDNKKSIIKQLKNMVKIAMIGAMIATWPNNNYAQTPQKNTNTFSKTTTSQSQQSKTSPQKTITQTNKLPNVDHDIIINSLPEKIFEKYWKEVGLELVREHFRMEINKIRKSYGKKEVVFDDYLNQRAQEYVEYMVKNKHFSHQDLEGRWFYEWVNDWDHHYFIVQENLWKWRLSIKSFIDGQMDSPRHKATIIEENFLNWNVFEYIWLGYRSWHWVAVFASFKTK